MMIIMTNEQLANRLMGQVQFNDALDETCRALMEEAADKLREKPAASTPVAGDAVADSPYSPAGIAAGLRWEHMRVALREEAVRQCLHKPHGQEWRPIVQADIDRLLDAALAQDHASQDNQ